MTRRAKPGDPRRAVAYLRVSTREQRLGPEAQRAAIERWARDHGVTVAAWYQDQGISGAAELDQRPGLMAAIDACHELGAGLLLVAKRDRLGRDIALVATVERLARSAGASVLSAAGEGTGLDVDSEEPGALLQRGMHDLLAAHERAVIRHRTRAALQVKRARGERVGHLPLGMRLAQDGRTLEPHPEERETIDQIRIRAAQGESQRTIARSTTNPRTGRPFHQPEIARILQQPTGAE